MSVKAKLLELNLSAGLFELSLEFLSLCLSNAFLNSLRSSLNQLLSLLKTKTADVLNSLDNSHLSVTEGSENYVKLGLLLSSGSSACACSGSSCNSSSGYAEFLFKSLNEFVQFENRQTLNFFNHSENLLRSHFVFLHKYV